MNFRRTPASRDLIDRIVRAVGGRTPERQSMTDQDGSPSGGSPDPMASLTARQRHVTDELTRQNPELGRWFSSAAILTHTRTPPTWPELVAHLCRDLINRLPEYFLLPKAERAEYGDHVAHLLDALGPIENLGAQVTLNRKARDALKGLAEQSKKIVKRATPTQLFLAAGRAESVSEAQARFLDAQWREVSRQLPKIAHLRLAGKPRADPERLLELFAQIETMLAGRIASPIWELNQQLAEIAAIAEPGADDLNRALTLARGDALNGFIDAVRSPAWLGLLRDAHLFDSPPSTAQVDGGGYRATPWAASRFLVRVADQEPELVAEILRSLPATDNAMVITDMLDAAASMPADQAELIAERIPALLGGPYVLAEANSAAELAAKLIIDGRVDAAMALVSALFAVTPVEAVRTVYWIDVAYPTVFDTEEAYEDGADVVREAAVSHCPIDATSTFVQVLAELLDRDAQVRGSDSLSVNSHGWRAAIEDHAQNLFDHDPRNTLVAAIRDLVVSAIAAAPDKAPELTAILTAQQSNIFRRIALHALRNCDFPEVAVLRREALLDRDLFNDIDLHHELFLLQRERFGELNPADQATVFTWIDEEPPHIDDIRSRVADKAEVQLVVDGWRQRHLAALEPALTGERRAHLDRLNAAHGTYPNPEFTMYTASGFVATEKPYTDEQLDGMAVAELLSLFDTWEPQGDGFGGRTEGLAMAVDSAARENPEHWAAIAAQLTTAPPLYRAYLISGLASAIAVGKTFELDNVFALAAAHVDDGPPAVADDQPRVVGRHAIADMLRWLIEVQPGNARQHAEPVWTLIERLAHDPEDDDEDDDPQWRAEAPRRAWKADDPDVPSGTVRSLAFVAATHYAKLLPDSPQARDLIRLGLNPDQNPTLEVRAAIAAQLAMITASNPSWAAELIGPMLLDTPDELADVAWAAQLDHRPTNIAVVRLLSATGANRFAVDYIAGKDRFSAARRQQLGTQILTAALFEAEAGDETLTAWFAREDGETRGRSVKAVGDALARSEVLPKNEEALRKVWRTRLGELDAADPELAAYTSWAPAVSDHQLGAELLVETLRKDGGKLISAQSVFDWAAEAAHTAPLDIIDMIDLVSVGSDPIQMVWNRHRLDVVIEHLVRFELTEVAEALGRLLERLSERGFGDLRPGQGG